MHIREPEVTSSVPVGEAFVIETEKVKDGCVKIVDVHAIFDGLETEFVSSAINLSALDAAAGQPHREAPVIVIPAIDLAGVRARCG